MKDESNMFDIDADELREVLNTVLDKIVPIIRSELNKYSGNAQCCLMTYFAKVFIEGHIKILLDSGSKESAKSIFDFIIKETQDMFYN